MLSKRNQNTLVCSLYRNMIIKIYFDCFYFKYYLRNVKYVFMYLKKMKL